MNNFIKKHSKHFNINTFIKNAFIEDVGKGDYTSLSTIPKNKTGKMKLLVKEKGIIAGVEVAYLILKTADKNIKLTKFIKDGDVVNNGDVVFIAEGNLQKLLVAERLLLNIMQRMSGIATKTKLLQNLCTGTKAKVIDTRKTTPGFRFFEKWAVIIGGGANHRYGLYDMILIKDNHIDFAGGITQAIDAANNYIKKNKLKIPIEVETRTIEDVKKVLAHKKVNRIMLDNYSIADTKKAVALINQKFEVESSGGINEATISSYAKCGVDFISIGALTHHIKSLDLSFKAIN
jgi:nicotinate-nucleotide pyrophosphorylase (carboxylating)